MQLQAVIAFSFLILVSVIGTTSATAQQDRIAAGTSFGTTGLTLEAKARLNRKLVARAGYNFLEFGVDDQEFDEIQYDAELQFSTFSSFLDVHPFATAFKVSFGAYVGERSIGLNAAAMGDTEVGGQTFTSAELGTLVGTASYDDVAPFLGLGWDNTFTARGAWAFALQAGVIISDSPDVELESVGGTLSNNPTLIAEVEAEEAQLEDDISDYKFYPVLSASASYRF